MTIYVYMYIYVCMHIYDIYSCKLYRFFTSLNKYDCYIANMIHTGITLNKHLDPTFSHTSAKHNWLQYILHILLLSMFWQHICPSNATYVNKFMCTWHNYVSIYASYELTAINNVTRITGVHTFHIIGTCTLNRYAHHIVYICSSAMLL